MTCAALITCYRRLEHLRQSLPLVLQRTPWEVFVATHHSDEETLRYLGGMQSPRLTAVLADLHQSGCFQKSKMQNALVAAATSAGHPWGVFLDADSMVGSRLMRSVEQVVESQSFGFIEGNTHTRDTTGLLVAPLAAVRSVGGYDETMVGWGAEDLDLRLRLFFDGGMTFEELPSAAITCLAHDDDLRTANGPDMPLMESHQRNAGTMALSYFRSTGRALSEDVVDSSTVRRLLGIEAPLRIRCRELVRD